MRTKLLCVALGLICASALLFACEKNPDTPPTPEQPQNTEYQPTVSNLMYDGFDIKFTPKDKKSTYYWSFISRDVVDSHNSDEDYITAENDSIFKAAEKNGMTLEQFIADANLLSADEQKFEVRGALDAETEYYVYVYALNAKGIPGTTMEKVLIKTPAAPPVVKRTDVTLSYEMNMLEAHAFGLVLYPSDMQMYIFTYYMKLDDYNTKHDGDKAKFAKWLEDAFANNAKVGKTTIGAVSRATCLKGIQMLGEFGGAPANTKYIAFAIGFDSQGRIITDIVTHQFQTLEETTSTAAVAIKAEKYFDGNELIKIDAKKYEKYKDKAYVMIKAEPNAEATYWFVRAGKAEGLKDHSDDILTDLVLEFGVQNKEYTILGAEWDVEYMLLGIAQDDGQMNGPLSKGSVTPTKSGASPISEFASAPASQVALDVLGGELSKVTKGNDLSISKFKAPSKFSIVKR